MVERRVEARVIGPGAPGYLKLHLGQRDRDVRADLLPPALRTPTSEFIAVVDGGEFVRVETSGRSWLLIQDGVRAVLNAHWDPIGVADEVEDEYDSYIDTIYAMLRHNASREELAAHLLQIETASMGLTGQPAENRLRVADRLLALDLRSP